MSPPANPTEVPPSPQQTAAPAAPTSAANVPPTLTPRAGTPPVRVAPGMPLVAGARLPLAFIIAGLVALLVAAGWTALHPAALVMPHMHPEVVAIAHLWLPGFLLSACMGAMYQLVPVILGTRWRGGESMMWIHFATHVTGVALLVAGFAVGRFETVAVGGALISAGAVLLAVAIIRTFADSTRRDVAAWCLPLAAGWLAMTVLVGVSLALLRRWPLLPFSPLGLLRAHAHLGLAGFFLTLLQGVTFQLVPMFTMGEARRPRAAAVGLAASQSGLLLLATGFALEWQGVVTAGAILAVLGIASSAVAFAATLRTRRRRELEPGLQGFVAGVTVLAVAAVAGLALLALPPGTAALRGAMAYGVIAIDGGVGLAVLGMLCKIIPFLVWMRTYGPRIGRQPVPVATSLASRPLERTWLILHVAALPMLIAAILLDSHALAAGGAWLLAVAIGAFLGNAFRVFRHTWHPQSPAAPPPAVPFAR
jgi:hypothetical protein